MIYFLILYTEPQQSFFILIRAAVDAMAKRSNDDEYPSDDFDLQLENQNGEKLIFNSDTDRRLTQYSALTS